MNAKAICYGAATIVNAIAAGRGAAFGIDLWTSAECELNVEKEFSAEITNASGEDTRLIELCARKTIEHFGQGYGASVLTESNIPIARGLKSSSVAANATVLATAAAIAKAHGSIRGDGSLEIGGKEVDDLTLINIGIDAALEAKVTITGAFDDASAAYFGGWVITDNGTRTIKKSGPMETLGVAIYVPREKTYTISLDVDKIMKIAPDALSVWETALSGDILKAMTENGRLYSRELEQDLAISELALEAGAISCGLSGTGPAVVALCDGDTKPVEDAWSQLEGGVIRANVNNKKAHPIK